MSSPSSSRSRHGLDIWPGFVDALATLLMVIIFVLLVFVLSQFYLSAALSGRDEALGRLNKQIAELSQMLSIEKESSAELRLNLAQLAAELQTSIAQRDQLQMRVSDLSREREALQGRLAQAEQGWAQDRTALELKDAEAARLVRDIDALRKVKDDLEARVGQLAARLDASERDLGALRDRSKDLEARLATAEDAKKSFEERTLLAQKDRDETSAKLTEQQKLTRESQDQVEALNRQMLALRQQLARISAVLEASEAKTKEQQVQIVDLGRRLNLALASKVEELARYRSEFFGRLREALGDRPDIRVVGDRFVFQSEVLFASGSATLAIDGMEQLWQLARTLRDVIQAIPTDINWVLQVDGHTDTVRIATPQFPSNWELSTARATSVVKFLISQGIPAGRLAAAGYGEFQPIEEGTDEQSRRRNRRIELKLTSR